MPAERSDTRLLIGAGAAAVLAGVFVAIVLLLATSRADSPKTYRPFPAGPEKQLRANLKTEGPFYYPDAFGGKRSILFALEGDQVVALMTHTAGDEACRIRWRGSVNSFVDCRGDRLRSFWESLVPFGVMVAAVSFVLVALQRDMGTAMVVVLIALGMYSRVKDRAAAPKEVTSPLNPFLRA